MVGNNREWTSIFFPRGDVTIFSLSEDYLSTSGITFSLILKHHDKNIWKVNGMLVEHELVPLHCEQS